jgi:hypothetical protein
MKPLLTTLPTNDLGLVTRSLPIARELVARGHEVAFSNPARAPSKLIAEERVGAAILVEPTIDRGRKKITPDELHRAVATALFDPGYRQNARSRVACELGRSEACGGPHCGIGQA